MSNPQHTPPPRLRPVPDSPGGLSQPGRVGDTTGRVAQLRGWLPPAEPAVFDCYLGELATGLDPFTEADPVGVLATLLAASGVHMGAGPHVVVGGFERHPALVWPLVIGNTGTGRKGTGFNVAKALLSHAVPDFVAENIHSGLSSGEGLAAVFADQEGDTTKRGRLLPDGDFRLLAYEPEWASVMARMKRDGNTLSATLRAAWEGGNLSTLNVDARMARRSHIGIVGHITPQEFRAKVSASDVAGGTYNRFLPVAVAQSKLLPAPEPVDPMLLLQYGADLGDRLVAAARLGAITLDPEAAQLWAQLYNDFTMSADGDGDELLAQFTSRAVPNTLRVAAIYAALDRRALVTVAHLAAAAAFVRYSIGSARVVLRGNTDDRIVAWIAAAGTDGRTATDLTRKFFTNASRTTDDPATVLDRLTTAGRITRQTRRPASGKGRPAVVYLAT